MEHQSKEVFGQLLEDPEFWQREPEERLRIVDFAADQFVKDDMPEDDLLKWNSNRTRSRIAARLGPEGYQALAQKLQDRTSSDPLPDELKDEGLMKDMIQGGVLNYGKTVTVNPADNSDRQSIPSIAQTGGGALEIPTGDYPIELKFLPVGSKTALDITTPNGVKRHKFESIDEVPKSGLELTRFLEENYAEDFGVGQGVFSETGGQIKAVGQKVGKGMVQSVLNVPNMLEMTITNVIHGDQGLKFAKENTIDENGSVVPMPKALKDKLYKDAENIYKSRLNEGATGEEYGFGGSPGISIDDAFIEAHRNHLKAIGDIDVRGRWTGENSFQPDPNFLPMGSVVQDGDKVTAEQLLAANIVQRDQPKAEELSRLYGKHLENVRAVNEAYAPDVSTVLRNSRDGLTQDILNLQQETGEVVGQALPMIPIALATGQVAALGGASAASIAMQAPAIVASAVTGYSGNMAESVSSVYEDNIKAGKSEADAIMNATDAGVNAALAAAPVDLMGDVALSRMFTDFNKAYRALPPRNRDELIKYIARGFDETVDEKKWLTGLNNLITQGVSESAGEFTRAEVTGSYQETPDSTMDNAKQALKEGALAILSSGFLSGVNKTVAMGSNLATRALVDNRLEAANMNASQLADLMRMPRAERMEAMQAYFDIGANSAAQGVPAPKAQGAALVPGRQMTQPYSGEQAVSDELPLPNPDDVAQGEAAKAADASFAEAPVTNEQSEIEALKVYGISPGDVITGVTGIDGPIRVLGAPLASNGEFAEVRGVLPNGEQIVFPEQTLDEGFDLASMVEAGATLTGDNPVQAELELVDKPAEPEIPTATPTAPAALVTPVGPLNAENIDFEKSTVTPDQFVTSDSGGTAFVPAAEPQRNNTIVIKDTGSVKGQEEASEPQFQTIQRDYEKSAAAVLTWATQNGLQPSSVTSFGDFAMQSGINPLDVVSEADWQAMGEYVNNLPVVVIGNEMQGNLAGANVRMQFGGQVVDGIILPKAKWEARTPAQRAETLIHEVLHSSIQDWSMVATSTMATTEMKATFKEATDLGEAILKAVGAANTPEGIAFRNHFRSVFNSEHYSQDKPHDLVEELMIRGLTNSRSRAMLQMVDENLKPIPPESSGIIRSMWDKIVSLFRQMAGWNGTKPQMESLMDAFLRLHKQMNEQRAPYMIQTNYGSREAASEAALDMGIGKDSFTVTPVETGFRLMIEETGMGRIREAQKTLDDAIERAWADEEAEPNEEQQAEVLAAQNKLSDLAESFFGGMANTTGANVDLSDAEQAAVAEASYQKAVISRENMVSQSTVLNKTDPSISDQLTKSGQNQESYNRFVVNRGVSLWASGIRQFPAWEKVMSAFAPNASLVAIWNNIEQSIGETVEAIGANGTNAFRPVESDPSGHARRTEYNAALRSGQPDRLQTFVNEAVSFSKTKMGVQTRNQLFNFGPLAGNRSQFLSVVRNDSGTSTLSLNREAYDREYQAALQNPEKNAERLVELDRVPSTFREAEQRIKGVKVAKAKLRSIFQDAASRMGLDERGATIIWNQLRMSGAVTGPEMSQAIEQALDRAVNQFTRKGVDTTKARENLKELVKMFRKAFYSVHKRSPESILDDQKAADVAKAAKAEARYLGATDGRQLAINYLQDGNVDELSLPELLGVYNRLILKAPFRLQLNSGYTSKQINDLLGQSLDNAYLTAFARSVRSAFLRQTVEDSNYGNSPLSATLDLWLGKRMTFKDEPLWYGRGFFAGGVDFDGHDLFTGLMLPIVTSVADAGTAARSTIENEITTEAARASAGLRSFGDAESNLPNRIAGDPFAPVDEKQVAARLAALRRANNLIVDGEQGSDTAILRARLADELLTTDPEFVRSFDKPYLDSLLQTQENEQILMRFGEVLAPNVPYVNPGKASAILNLIQDLRGGLRTNLPHALVADFSQAPAGQMAKGTRQDRRNEFATKARRYAFFEARSLQKAQTDALMFLAGGDPSRAMELARQLIVESVTPRGFASAEGVSQQIEQMLTELAGSEKNVALAANKPLEAFMPRIEGMLPISPQKARLALLDGKAEVSNVSDLISQFSLMNDAALSPVLSGFLRGNTRSLPVLLLDTAGMSEESAQAFRESELLGNRPSRLIPADPEAEGEQSDFLVVDVGTLKDDSLNRIVAEGIRDALKEGDLKNAGPFLNSLSEAAVALDHAVRQLEQRNKGNFEANPADNRLITDLNRVSESFEQMGPLNFAIEILSNPSFRHAVAAIDPQLIQLPSPTKSSSTINKMAKGVISSDINEAGRKYQGFGLSFDQVEEQLSSTPDESDAQFGNIQAAFDQSFGTDLLVVNNDARTLSEDLLTNAMQVLWSAGNYQAGNGFVDTSMANVDTELATNSPAWDFATTVADAQLVNKDGELKAPAQAAFAEQVAMTGAVIRSIRSRAGNSYVEWVNASDEQAAIDNPSEATPTEVAAGFRVKAMALPDNPLSAGTYTNTIPDPESRREAAKIYARDYWQAVMGSAEYRHIMRDIGSKPYAMQWMRDNPQKELADLAEYMMRPTVGRSVKADIHKSISAAFTTDVGVQPTSMHKLRLERLHDEWRTRIGRDMAIRFLTGTKFNPVSFTAGFNSLQRFAHNDAVYRIYGAASPVTMDQIMDLMGIMDSGVTGNRGHNGFRSKMIDLEKRFEDISKPMGHAKRNYVRATLAGLLTQFNVDADPAKSVASLIEELEKGYMNLITNGKDSRGLWKLRKVFRQEMDRLIPLANDFVGGAKSKDDYVASMRTMLSPAQLNWLDETRKMFSEIRPAMEAASRMLGRDMGLIENYFPMLNGKLNLEGTAIDNLFRAPGQKVGTSRAGSMNKRFVKSGNKTADFILNLDGSQIINKLRRDIYTLETVQGGLLLHEILGTKDPNSTEYDGAVMRESTNRLNPQEKAQMRTVLLGLRGVYDRTRTGFQQGLNIDNKLRRIMTTAQQIGAYKSLADLEQIPKQMIPAVAVYNARIAANTAKGDTTHLKASLGVAGALTPGKADLRSKMTQLMKKHAPSIFLRGFDGNAAFKEKLSLEIVDEVKGLGDIGGMAKQVLPRTLGAVRTGSRLGLDWTVGKPDAFITTRIFFTEYTRLAYAAGLNTMDQVYDEANWNPKWARIAKAKAEEIMGSSSIEERGTVMQTKGSTVSREALVTAVRAYGIHNISLAAHARALGNEFIHGDFKQKMTAVGKFMEIGLQQAIFNALAKPTRDLFLAQIISLMTGKKREDVYFWLLNKWPLDKKTNPYTGGYDWFQSKGWKSLFDMTPMLGAYGAALSLPVVNDLIREALAEPVLKPMTAKLLDKPEYKPFNKPLLETLVGATGYVGVTAESLVDGAKAGYQTGEWGKVALAQIATRGISARILQELEGKGKGRGKSGGSSSW